MSGMSHINQRNRSNFKMMTQFVIWKLRGVKYLCLRTTPGDCFLITLKRV